MQTVYSCAGKLLDLCHPVVMGILNITPDSFYDGGHYPSISDQLARVEKMLEEGATIIDIGAISSRPGAEPVDEEVETKRVLPVLTAIGKYFPEAIVSVDTFRSGVAKKAIENGAGMINDIYGGRYDSEMIRTVQSAGIPYIIMHMQGDPENMQVSPHYKNIVEEISSFFQEQIGKFQAGFSQIILDPGFGFGKTTENNFQLLCEFQTFKTIGFPLMAGLSRKSMINRVIHTKPSEALNGTTVLNTVALMKGADILRVHDVREAVETIALVSSIPSLKARDKGEQEYYPK
jgi:dihydropteroate synthase